MIEVTAEDLLSMEWFPVQDTTLGGWAVATVDKPPSEHDYSKAERTVCAVIRDEVVARHIAELHNERLDV